MPTILHVVLLFIQLIAGLDHDLLILQSARAATQPASAFRPA